MNYLDAFLSFPVLMLFKAVCLVSGHRYEECVCECCGWSGELCRLCGADKAREGKEAA